jgi:hypothetical protein
VTIIGGVLAGMALGFMGALLWQLFTVLLGG